MAGVTVQTEVPKDSTEEGGGVDQSVKRTRALEVVDISPQTVTLHFPVITPTL